MTNGQNTNERVALGMSGGVDSAVSAELLRRAGFEVVGVTCLFTDCEASRAAAADAARVCSILGIEHVCWNAVNTFNHEVVDSFVQAYAEVFTPSPCVVCNRTCKIPSLLAAADENGCSKVATGQYARIVGDYL